MLGSLLGRKDPKAVLDSAECFGESRIGRRLGDEILRATAARRNHVQGLRDKLSSLSREEKDELVDRLFARVALFVYDLPASERNHHSVRFGLLDHLLEVAHHTVRVLSAPGFQVSPEPSTNHRERPLWVYAGLVGAVAHDFGKPLDLVVSAPGKGESWDPRKEPLRLFCQRHSLLETGPALWHWTPKRGLRGHEKNLTVLLPVVLTPEVTDYLGPRLGSVLDAMTRDEEWQTPPGGLPPAKEVVRVIRRMDGSTSARNDLEGKAALVPPLLVALPPLGPGPTPEQRTLPFPPLTDRAKDAHPPLQPLPLPKAQEGGQGATKEEGRIFFPKDFWHEPVPEKRTRPGDPAEVEHRLRAELDPARFLDTLRRMVVARRLSRNNLCTEIYIRTDFVWFMLPRALRRVALINHLPFDRGVLSRMLSALQVSPQVAAGSPDRVQVFMKPRPEAATFEAVRVRTPGFLTQAQVDALGIHAYDIRAIESESAWAPGK